jgi:mannose-1-phosphate guanylyltransferase/phosphomannomutase
VVWTKLSTPHLQQVSCTEGATFAASQEGGYIFPSFLPAYDAAATLVHTLHMLSQTGLRLSKIVSTVPRVHIAHETVPTPWEQKGLVMRSLVEGIKDHELVLVDGVKVLHDDGWALVLPDPEEPLTHVWAEGDSADEARSLARQYVASIRKLLR